MVVKEEVAVDEVLENLGGGGGGWLEDLRGVEMRVVREKALHLAETKCAGGAEVLVEEDYI